MSSTPSPETATPDPPDREPCIACREPIRRGAAVCPRCRSPQSPQRWRNLGSALRWVGGITAVISLIAGVVQLSALLESTRERSESVEMLLRAAEVQIEIGEFDSALELIERALQLEPGSREAGERQVSVAMMLVRQFDDFSDEKADFMDSLMPILRRGAGAEDPVRAADVLGHVGWANHLRGKHRDTDLPIEDYFERALELDPGNVFAHAMWANWCLTNRKRPDCNGNLETAVAHYTAALESGRHADYVKAASSRALRASSVDGIAIYLFETNIERRRRGEDIDPTTLEWILSEAVHFTGTIGGWKRGVEQLDELLEEARPAEVLELLDLASQGRQLGRHYTREEAFMAHLAELAGDVNRAIATYRRLRARIRAEEVRANSAFSSVRERIDRALVDLLEIRPAALGIRLENMTEELAGALGAPATRGAIVSEVLPGGPAEEAGILAGDVLLEAAGKPVEKADLQILLGSALAGDELDLIVLRSGSRQSLRVTLGAAEVAARPSGSPQHGEAKRLRMLLDNALYRPAHVELSGRRLELAGLNAELRAGFGFDEDLRGVLVLDSDPRGEAIAAGDVILEIDQRAVTDPMEVVRAVREARSESRATLLITRRREASQKTVAVALDGG